MGTAHNCKGRRLWATRNLTRVDVRREPVVIWLSFFV